MTNAPHHLDRFLTWPEVHALVRLSRTTVWRIERLGEFPKRRRISRGRVAWREAEILAWIRGTCTPDDT